jgi:integrase/recombinase XerD
MSSYEQTLHLFGRWLSDELQIYTVDKITENVILKYIDDLMVRGKYTFCVIFVHSILLHETACGFAAK